MTSLKEKVRIIKRDAKALYFAMRDPRTPWYAKVFAAMVVGYALSPIDLIPDFIPIIGYLDDIILVPLGILVAVRMIPAEVMSECRKKAEEKNSQLNPASQLPKNIIDKE